MAINFEKFNKEQRDNVIKSAIELDDANALDVVGYQGGYLPKRVYQSLMRADELHVLRPEAIATSVTGAQLAVLVGLLANSNRQEHADDELMVQFIDHTAVHLIGEFATDKGPEMYHDWYTNSVFPPEVSATAIMLFFVAEVFDAFVVHLRDSVGGEVLAAIKEAQNASKH
jgi:hypothetical protein